MRPWVLWCVKHRLSFIVYVALFLIAPIYIVNYFREAYDDFVGEYKYLKQSIAKYWDSKK